MPFEIGLFLAVAMIVDLVIALVTGHETAAPNQPPRTRHPL